jgi:hypothetical protein
MSERIELPTKLMIPTRAGPIARGLLTAARAVSAEKSENGSFTILFDDAGRQPIFGYSVDCYLRGLPTAAPWVKTRSIDIHFLAGKMANRGKLERELQGWTSEHGGSVLSKADRMFWRIMTSFPDEGALSTEMMTIGR